MVLSAAIVQAESDDNDDHPYAGGAATEGRKLYQWTEDGDSLIFDFSFEVNTDFRNFFEEWLPNTLEVYMMLPAGISQKFEYNTVATFPNGEKYRVVYVHSERDEGYKKVDLPD